MTASERLTQLGPNVIAHDAAPSRLKLILKRSVNPLVLLLFALAIISFFLGDIGAAGMMMTMILISVCLGSIQESRSNRAAAELEQMVSTSATVIRKRTQSDTVGTVYELPQKALVPGDIIRLSSGDLIPADIRLLSSKDLSITQAILTGESMPVDKHTDRSSGPVQSPFELTNICFMGTSVISGTATAVVCFTGKETYLGRLAKSIVGQRAPTDFDRGIAKFTWLMIRFILIMAPIVFLLNGAVKGNWFEALLFALSVAVGLTPEMLPMIVTVNLAKGAIAMSKHQVIVKKLNSIQNFGGMDVLCTDKTGTLTENRVVLERHLDVHGQEAPNVLIYAYLNSFHQSGLKNLLDVAVLKRGDLDHIHAIESQFEKVDELPFDFVRKRMSVIVRKKESGDHILVCKGAVEEVYQACVRAQVGNEIFSLDASHSLLLSDLTRTLNEDGFRVVAVAIKNLAVRQNQYQVSDENQLTLIGYLAFLDPPKDTAAQAIRELRNSGVSVKILTGDNEIITRKICKDVGLDVDRILLGNDIDKLSDVALATVSSSTTLFAKLSPDQKARIVRTLQSAKHVVGYLGDGINDGPALRAADVGISVDSAVDIAKESADIILLQKSLTVLHDGVIEGRKVFANILKYIKMNASSNFGNMLSVLGASAFLPFLPMQPIQVLTNNLLYDISQTTIPTDNVDPEFLLKPQKWEMNSMRRFILGIGPISSLFDYITFFALWFWFGGNQNPRLFQTGWFIESLITQTLIIHVIRTNRIPFLQSRSSVLVMTTTLAISVFALWLPRSPLAPILRLTQLPSAYWIFLLLTILSYMGLTQLIKIRLSRWFGIH